MRKEVLILLTLIFFSCNKEKTSPDLFDLNLKGKVESIKVNSFLAIEKFGEITTGERKNKNGSEYLLEFDNKGNKTKKQYFNINDLNGNSETFLHNEKGLVTEEIIKDLNGKLLNRNKFKYSNKGKLIEVNDYLPNGILKRRHIYKYTDYPFPKSISIYGNDGKLQDKLINEYNNKNIRIQTSAYNGDGTLFVKWKINRDKYENIIQEDTYGEKENLLSSETYEYVYDKMNNWIEKRETIDGKVKFIVKRKIEYYK